MLDKSKCIIGEAVAGGSGGDAEIKPRRFEEVYREAVVNE